MGPSALRRSDQAAGRFDAHGPHRVVQQRSDQCQALVGVRQGESVDRGVAKQGRLVGKGPFDCVHRCVIGIGRHQGEGGCPHNIRVEPVFGQIDQRLQGVPIPTPSGGQDGAVVGSFFLAVPLGHGIHRPLGGFVHMAPVAGIGCLQAQGSNPAGGCENCGRDGSRRPCRCGRACGTARTGRRCPREQHRPGGITDGLAGSPPFYGNGDPGCRKWRPGGTAGTGRCRP
jgi:hypothetical protein